jgi:hypothetical protein
LLFSGFSAEKLVAVAINAGISTQSSLLVIAIQLLPLQ